jgi:hypothetical protein
MTKFPIWPSPGDALAAVDLPKLQSTLRADGAYIEDVPAA